MSEELKQYESYFPVKYDYVHRLPKGWRLLPNIAIFRERKEKGTTDEQLLSISSYKGIVKTSDNEDRKDRSSDDKSEYLLVKEGDLAYNTMLMWSGAVGHSQYRGIVSPSYTVLKPKIEINPKYFHYQFRNEIYRNYAKRYSYGIVDSRLRLYYVHFKRMYSILPPIEIQNSIVAYLDEKSEEIEKFVKNKQKLIKLFEEEKNKIIDKTITRGLNPNVELKFSGMEWLGYIPKHWNIKRLRYVGKCQNGVSRGGEYFGSGYPFVNYDDVYKNMILPSMASGLAQSTKEDRLNYSVQKGDILFTRTSETIEEIGFSSTCCKTIDNATFSGFLIRFRPSSKLLHRGFSKYYFRSQLHRAFFVKEMNLVIRASLSQELLKKLPIILPPLEEQENIGNFLDDKLKDIDLAVSKANEEILAIREYQESLITNIITGQKAIPM